MSETETILIVNQEKTEARQVRGLVRFLNVLGLALVWAFVFAGIIGSLTAAMWTIIPTEMLDWGASTVNLIGYVSHCSYVPLSTIILLAVTGVMTILAYKLKRGRSIGLGVLTGTAGGLLIGLLGGVGVTMFIGMGSGVGIGILLGIITGMIRRVEV